MPTIEETATGQTPLAGALNAGLENISYSQRITLRRYIRNVLPLDGFVFWVRAPLPLSGGDLLNANPLNTVPNNQGATPQTSRIQIEVRGSMHFTTISQQQQDNSAAINPAILTTPEEVRELNHIDPNVMWVALFDPGPDGDVQEIAFGESSSRYHQAGIWHYRGQALNATLRSQLVDSPSDLRKMEPVVSNSLPVWLSLNEIVQLYPSYAVPQNLPPPYGVVHIEPSSTQALQDIPWRDSDGSSWQLMRDMVKVTLYGVRNNEAVDFQNYVLDYMVNEGADVMGLMSMPVIQDDKQPQVQFQVLAQKKAIFFEVSYYQARMLSLARQLILSATIDIAIIDNPYQQE